MASTDDKPNSSPPPPSLPFHLLEITIISAQDLCPTARSLPTYALAWVHPSHKPATRLDPSGGSDPTWNDKFVFRVDDTFLLSDTAAITIQIFRGRRFPYLLPDHLVGTAGVVVSTLRPSSSTRFVALQVRRPSSRPQGIINLGVALLDGSVSALPLYYDLGSPSAFAYRDLISRPSITRRHSEVDLENAEKIAEAAAMRRSNSVAVGSWEGEREMEMLESKLEKWRTDLSPGDLSPVHEPGEDHEVEMAAYRVVGGGRARKKAHRRSISCFCGTEQSAAYY